MGRYDTDRSGTFTPTNGYPAGCADDSSLREESGMICQPCLQGAAHNRAWRAGGGGLFLDLAAGEHAECKGCSCQHAIGADSLVVLPL